MQHIISMDIKIGCYWAQLVILLSYCIAQIPQQPFQEYLCLRTMSVSGRTHVTFLHRSSPTGSLLFFWTMWTTESQAGECLISADGDLTADYMTLCREEGVWDSSQTAPLPLSVTQLLEAGSPCKFLPSSAQSLERLRRDLDPEIRTVSPAKSRQKRAWVVPGTLWCGRGSSAGEYEQLGMFEHVDRCCRDHDHCDHVIRPFTINFGVFNPSLFTISHCDCDHRFKKCLLDVNDTVSNMVGYTFFNIFKHRCFDLLPKKRCTKLNWFGMCTSAKVAPLAVFKNPTPYESTSSDLDSNKISKYQKKPTVTGKKKKKKEKERKARNDQITSAKRNNILMKDQIHKQFGKIKKSSPRTSTVPPPNQKTMISTNSSVIFHQTNRARFKETTLSVQKYRLINQTTACPAPLGITHIHMASRARSTTSKKMAKKQRRTTSFQSLSTKAQEKSMQRLNLLKQSFDFINSAILPATLTSNLHKTSNTKGGSFQNTKHIQSNKMHKKGIKTTTPQSHNTKRQMKSMRRHKTLTSLNCTTMGCAMGHNLQAKQQKRTRWHDGKMHH